MPNCPSHEEAIIIDGLVIAKQDRPVFEAMRGGGHIAIKCTCAVWEGPANALAKIAEWERWFIEHSDLITQIHNVSVIYRAKNECWVSIILGRQNTFAIETNLDLFRIIKEPSVHLMQLTYNTQNLVGSGCWQTID